MWIGDFVRGPTVVTRVRQRWPTGRGCCDLALRSPGRYMPASAPGSSGTCRAGLAVARQGVARCGAPVVMERAVSAPPLEGPPSHRRWRDTGTGGFFRRKPGRLINGCGVREVKACPASSTRNAAMALPAGAKLPPEWRCRASRPPRNRRAGGQATASAPDRGGARARLGRTSQNDGPITEAAAAGGRTGF